MQVRPGPRRWMRWRAVPAALVLALGCGQGGDDTVGGARSVQPAPPPVRLSMAALHATGGVPVDWKLLPPPGDVARGRRLFAQYGCPSCHVVQGETFAEQGRSPGPELTGMGAHHPPGYFVEAILNPDAIIVEGEGYAGESGLSTMPAYPDMPLVDLTDVVAYLGSLTAGHDHAAMMAAAAGVIPSNLRDRPAAPAQRGAVHLVMRYDLLAGKLGDFEAWFRDTGRAAFLAVDGLERIDTYVTGGGGPTMTSIFTFRDEATLGAFLASPDGVRLGEDWDRFIGSHGHEIFRRPPVYRAESLSAAR